MTAALKQSASTQERQADPISEQLIKQRHLEAAAVMAEWQAEILRKNRILQSRMELIGGVTEEEIEAIRAESELYKLCFRALSWNPSSEVGE